MPRSGSLNGGVIGVNNKTSFGKNTVTIKTSGSSTITTQSGTRVANVVVVGGGVACFGGFSSRRHLIVAVWVSVVGCFIFIFIFVFVVVVVISVSDWI